MPVLLNARDWSFKIVDHLPEIYIVSTIEREILLRFKKKYFSSHSLEQTSNLFHIIGEVYTPEKQSPHIFQLFWFSDLCALISI